MMGRGVSEKVEEKQKPLTCQIKKPVESDKTHLEEKITELDNEYQLMKQKFKEQVAINEEFEEDRMQWHERESILAARNEELEEYKNRTMPSEIQQLIDEN